MDGYLQGRSAYEPLQTREPFTAPGQPTIPPTEASNPRSIHGGTSYTESRDNRTNPFVQHYDERGRPRNNYSRLLSRRSRRAQNDVLATVGVLLGPDQVFEDAEPAPLAGQRRVNPAKDNDKTISESAAGYWMGITYLVAQVFSTERTLYVRQRLQTFRLYTGVPCQRTLRTEWRTLGPSLLHFAGLPGELLSSAPEPCLNLAVEFNHLIYEDYMAAKVLRTRSKPFSHLFRFGAAATGLCLQACILSILAPIQFHAVLQGLGLVSPWPPCPHWKAFVPFTAASLIRPIYIPATVTFSSGLQYLSSIVTSPVVLWYCLKRAHSKLARKIGVYMDLSLPHPDYPNPDLVIRTGSRNIPWPTPATDTMSFERGTTVRSQTQVDWTDFRNYLSSWTSWWRSPIKVTQSWKPTASVSGPEGTARSEEDPSTAQIQSRRTDTGHANDNPERGDIAESAASEEWLDSSLISRPSPPRTDSQGGSDPLASQSGSDDWQANIEGSELGITSPKPKHDAQIPLMPRYHVTILSTLLSRAMTMNLSICIADILLLPLDALYARSVALAYLDTAGAGASYAAMGLGNEIYPLGSWLGFGLRGGSPWEYARKIALCFGLEMLIRGAAWQLTAGATWWVGRKYYAWGNL
ncbi:MAG: hypothetical protein Q9223_000225 [Gallowayella weberi]